MRILLLLVLSYFYLLADAHIFLYHRFGDDRYPSTNTSVQELRKHFEYFKNNDYKVVSIEKIIKRIHNKKPLPDNWIALTIDDAYKSFYDNGLPLFREYNYPFSIYTQVAGRENKQSSVMHWEQLKEITQYGSVELHSYSHDHLTHMSKEEIYNDTKKALQIFTRHMGYTPSIFAYPFGEYDEKVKHTISLFNFKGILNQNNGSVNHKSDPHDLNRIALVGNINIKEKLRYKTLDVQWIEPLTFPKDAVLKKVRAKVNKEIKRVKLYVTNHGWRDIKVNDGIIDVNLNLGLTNKRSRVVIGTDYYTIANKILIKNKEN